MPRKIDVILALDGIMFDLARQEEVMSVQARLDYLTMRLARLRKSLLAVEYQSQRSPTGGARVNDEVEL